MRTLGGTGIRVSSYCLGAMMFGRWGNRDHEEHPDHSRGAGRRHQLRRTADVYGRNPRRSSARRCWPPRRVVLATKAYNPMGEDPNMRGNSRRWIVREGRKPAPSADRQNRPVPGAPSRPGHRDRRDPVRAVGPRPQRQGPRDRHVDVPGGRHRRGPVGRESRDHVRFVRTAAVLVFSRGVEAAVLPTCETYGIGALAWSPLNGGWLTGRIRQDTASTRPSRGSGAPRALRLGGPVNGPSSPP